MTTCNLVLKEYPCFAAAAAQAVASDTGYLLWISQLPSFIRQYLRVVVGEELVVGEALVVVVTI